MTPVTLELVSEQLGQLLVEVRRIGERQERQDGDLRVLREQQGMMEGDLHALHGEVHTLREQQERDRQTVQERFGALEAKIDALTGGDKVSLAFLGQLVERMLGEIRELKGDIEVQSAIIRRFDARIESHSTEFRVLLGEVRALVGQQDRQRQKLDRLQKQLEDLERGRPAPA